MYICSLELWVIFYFLYFSYFSVIQRLIGPSPCLNFFYKLYFSMDYISMNYVFKWYYIVSICHWSILCSGKYFKLNTSHLALPRWIFPSQAWLAVEADVRVCHGCFDSPVILIQGSDPCGLSIILLTLQREQHSRHWTVNR